MYSLLDTIKTCVNATKLSILAPVLFIIFPFIGSKFSKKGEWNEEYFTLQQTSVIKGFCAIGIILHHCSQRNAAGWIPSVFIIHGLDFFVDIGYLFVAVFLFFSGYGLYVSYKKKDNYFKYYFSRRFFPVVLAYITTSLVYYLYGGIKSSYTWYIAAILICYFLFYIGFKFFKNEYISLSIVLFGIVVYCVTLAKLEYGGWWYNTIGLFFVGLIFAKYEKNIIGFFKKAYIPFLIIAIILTLVFKYYGRYYETAVYFVEGTSKYDLYNSLIIIYRFLAGVCFTLSIILISLKCKFNNKLLTFYETISLEFYLIQGLFVQMFSFSYFDVAKPLYYIKNVWLYTLVVFICSTIVAYILKKIHKFIIELLKKISLDKVK